MPGDDFRRRSARVLLLDASGRVLLFQTRNHPDKPESGHCWITPGGGVKGGETLAEAAARELREETGLCVPPVDLAAPVATTSGYADFGWARGFFRDDFFHHRVDSHEVDTTAFEARERASFIGHRWWGADELAVTAETVYPFRLAELVRDLAAGRVPAEPVRLPWHHADHQPPVSGWRRLFRR